VRPYATNLDPPIFESRGHIDQLIYE